MQKFLSQKILVYTSAVCPALQMTSDLKRKICTFFVNPHQKESYEWQIKVASIFTLREEVKFGCNEGTIEPVKTITLSITVQNLAPQ